MRKAVECRKGRVSLSKADRRVDVLLLRSLKEEVALVLLAVAQESAPKALNLEVRGHLEVEVLAPSPKGRNCLGREYLRKEDLRTEVLLQLNLKIEMALPLNPFLPAVAQAPSLKDPDLVVKGQLGVEVLAPSSMLQA